MLLGSFPVGLPGMSAGLMAEYPKLSFIDAWKAGFTFGMKEPLGVILSVLICMMVAMSGMIACFVGIVVTVPLISPFLVVIYEDHREGVLEAAKEAGVELA